MERLTQNKRKILAAMPRDGEEAGSVIRTRTSIPSGTFYPTLRALTESGLLTRELGTVGHDRPAWIYQLTPVGKQLVEALDAGEITNPADWQTILNDNEGET